MVKKDDINETDKALFREAMRGVQAITQTKKLIHPHLPPARPKPKSQIEAEYPPSPLSDYEKLDLVDSDDYLEFNRSGISHKVLRKMRLGQYNVEAVLDLHGMTVAEANESLHRFILQCKQAKKQHVLMIHGKGRGKAKPILKNKLNHWLRQLEQVLAFCSASAKDGCSGALYVLLKGR